MEHKLYVVRNKQGKFFKAKGYNGYGESWVDELKSAKIYGSIGPARGRVTWWFKNYPKYGMPDLVEISITDKHMSVIDESDRVSKVIKKHNKAIKLQEVRRQKKIALHWWNHSNLRENMVCLPY